MVATTTVTVVIDVHPKAEVKIIVHTGGTA